MNTQPNPQSGNQPHYQYPQQGNQQQGNGWVPPTPKNQQNGPHGGYKFFQAMRNSGFFRSEDRWIGGVAGGLARKLNVDPIIVRLVLIILGVTLTGVALVAYAAAWALLPEERDGRIHAEELFKGNFDGAVIAIAITALLGFGSLGGSVAFGFNVIPEPLAGLFWVALLAAGAYATYVVYTNHQESKGKNTMPQGTPNDSAGPTHKPDANADQDAATQVSNAPKDSASAHQANGTDTRVSPNTSQGFAPQAPANSWQQNAGSSNQTNGQYRGAAGTYPSQAQRPYSQGTYPTNAANFNGNGPGPGPGSGSVPGASPRVGNGMNGNGGGNSNGMNGNGAGGFAQWDASALPVAKEPSGGFLISFALTLIAAALVLGGNALGLLSNGTLALPLIIAVSAIIGGIVVAINGMRGKTSGSAGFFSILALLAGVFIALPTIYGSDYISRQNFHMVSEQNIAPTTIEQLETEMSFGVGDFVLDLTKLSAAELREIDEPLQLQLSGGIGNVELILPQSVPVAVNSDIGVGGYADPLHSQSGIGIGSVIYDHEGNEVFSQEVLVDVDISLGIGDISITSVPDTLATESLPGSTDN